MARKLYIAVMILYLLLTPVNTWAKSSGQDDSPPLTDLEIAAGLNIHVDDVQAFRLLADRFGGYSREDLEDFQQSDLFVATGNSDWVASISAGLHDVTFILENVGLPYRLDAPPLPTGDELFDRYAAQVHAQLLDGDYHGFINHAWVSDEVLAQWEADFGDDPRYWELRFLCYDNMSYFDRQYPEHYSVCTGFLQEAIDRGIATANTLMVLYNYLRFSDEERHRAQGEYRIEIAPEFAMQLAALLDTAVELADDQAVPFYQRAFFRIEAGAIEEGLADLAIGNSQPMNTPSLPFPRGKVKAGINTLQPVGTAAVDGAIDTWLHYQNSQTVIHIDDHMLATLALIENQDDLYILDTWLDYIFRQPDVMDNQAGYYLSQIIVLWKLMDYVESQLPDILTPTQLEMIRRLRGGQVEYNREFQRAMPYSTECIRWELPMCLAGRSMGTSTYFFLYEAVRTQDSAERMSAIFTALNTVDIRADEIPEQLMQFEPMTEADRKQAFKEMKEERQGR